MCNQKISHFHFQNGWPYIVYHTALFVNDIKHSFIASDCSIRSLRNYFRGYLERNVNDDITSYNNTVTFIAFAGN